MRLLAPTIAALVIGSALMLLFDAALTRVVGVLALFAFIVLGVFLIATPEYLAGEGDDQSPGG